MTAPPTTYTQQISKNYKLNQLHVYTIDQLHMFLCGSKTLGHEDKNGSRKRSKKSKSISNFNKKIINKNPYADGGVDKFLALVADLEEKKQRIYDEMGTEEISLIRFVYDDFEQVKPIVVRANNKTKKMHVKGEKSVEEKREIYVKAQEELRVMRKRHHANFYFIYVILVLILVFLAIYGRSLAIMCTSIAWYLVPQFVNRLLKRKVSGRIS